MLQTATLPSLKPSVRPTLPHDIDLEDNSPFGVQGLARETLQILKPDCINRLAVALALRGTPDQIRDASFVRQILAEHPEWMDEYQVVHLIERSLWIQGHSDLVMTLIRNPTQIPDNPPTSILQALSRAYALHPDATVWYGVPVFGDEKTAEGLPIPVTAQQVRTELLRRLNTAVRHARRWGWLYRAMLGAVRLPSRCWRGVKIMGARIQSKAAQLADYWKRARTDARRRERAKIAAELERCRTGQSWTQIPEHRTWLGQSLEAAGLALNLAQDRMVDVVHVAPFLSMAIAPTAIATFTPMLLTPIVVVSMDPFLFVELPNEPGKLRHIGHWYWQIEDRGTKKLHVHV
ncbi:MAG: hypothetical protein AABP62_06395 [Planctomycetota bacterium]